VLAAISRPGETSIPCVQYSFDGEAYPQERLDSLDRHAGEAELSMAVTQAVARFRSKVLNSGRLCTTQIDESE